MNIANGFNPSDVLRTFGTAAVATATPIPLAQAMCKTLVVRTADSLASQMQLSDRPTLWASGTRSPGEVRYARVGSGESMLDVAVYAGNDDPFRPLITAESEAYPSHDVAKTANSATSGCAWDLFKLLQVPSPIRVYLCRLPYRRHADAWALIERLVHAYCSLYSTGDRLFAIVLPTADRDYDEVTCRGWLARAGGVRELHAARARPRQRWTVTNSSAS